MTPTQLGFRQPEETHLMESAICNESYGRRYLVDVGDATVSGHDA